VTEDFISHRVELPRGPLAVFQPSDVAGLPDDGDVRWAPLAPYWAVLWRSGVALAGELDRADLSGQRVIELGCGLGLPSLVAARAGAVVLATDADPEALELLEQNAGANGVELETAEVDWARPQELLDRDGFDLVVAADVLYEDAAIDQLAKLLPQLAPEAWIADPGRPGIAALLERLQLSTPPETTTHDVVTVHRVRFA
jgi:predicted nicotinamide N-methyase